MCVKILLLLVPLIVGLLQGCDGFSESSVDRQSHQLVSTSDNFNSFNVTLPRNILNRRVPLRTVLLNEMRLLTCLSINGAEEEEKVVDSSSSGSWQTTFTVPEGSAFRLRLKFQYPDYSDYFSDDGSFFYTVASTEIFVRNVNSDRTISQSDLGDYTLDYNVDGNGGYKDLYRLDCGAEPFRSTGSLVQQCLSSLPPEALCVDCICNNRAACSEWQISPPGYGCSDDDLPVCSEIGVTSSASGVACFR